MKEYVYEVNTDGQDAPAKVLRAVGIGKRVLEVGCASGVQTRILKERQHCTVTGIEINAEAAKSAEPFCEYLVIGDLETLDLGAAIGDRRYDVITIADVLEHLRNPGQVLRQLTHFLDEGGYIVASIPNVVHAGLILDMANGRFDYRPYGLLDDTHLRFFTLKTVHKLFEECRLEIVDMDRVSRTVEGSEFFHRPLSPDESAVLHYVQAHNKEWQTYQFIVKARLGLVHGPEGVAAKLDRADHVHRLELENSALRKQIAALGSRLHWVESRPAYRMLSRIRRLLP